MNYIFILALLLVFPQLGLADATTDWTKNSVLIEEGTDLQNQIDEITIEIFNSSLKKTFCQVFQNAASARHSLAISAKAAVQIFADCPKSELAGGVSKTLSKSYFISFTSMPNLDSWTDFGNRTYIFSPESLTRARLKSIILHEMAISTDAKTNMLLSTYFLYRAQNHYTVVGNTTVVTMDNLSAREEALRQAFNGATWSPVSLTFAALRAFNVELTVEQRKLLANSHEACVADFRSLFSQIKNLPPAPKSSQIDQIAEMLAELTSKNSAPKTREDEDKLIDFLLSENLQLTDAHDNRMTFCQFMAFPMLTGNSVYSFFGSGPRPRLTGGSGGQGGMTTVSKNGEAQLNSDLLGRLSMSKESLKGNERIQEAIKRLRVKNGIEIGK